ncbi:quinol:cytochrome c oxidoreductase pentaheme cytochrome subunit [Dyella jiangningensis]|uniref:cytochrome c3 family protein n=1 Tax=Dyella sp. AtDHG13 TaxID=1938897 RepID=UPI0008889FD9|nr:cytochrome c3 family protein [Dyella sp. AtDHG13]PXV55853.1 quinol:cytochrome c oxidoreductase pentaheme cytochrome subunit [Dyella sp. AtDHG13]SDK53821.1 quinol:cytochrome c oxidoreductase pentaheme cytochrome subunit [Dyella jiangningensis]
MAQVFSRYAGFYARLALIALLVLTTSGVLAWRALTAERHTVNETVEQPVPFSHKHHVGDVGLDCRYCHASVETSAQAGMPPVSTCMTCHSQLFTDQRMLAPVRQAWISGQSLAWRRVNQLPDFVYFNHSIHVAKGVGCVSCHGRVDQMPLMRRTETLSMKWCLDCHRDPEQQLRPREHVFDMAWTPKDQRSLGIALVQAYRIDRAKMMDCSLCHR